MWLYVPGLPETSYPYAQASEDLNSEYTSPLNIGERLAEASVMWRSKPAQPAVWFRRWRRVGWIKRLSGLTCEHSTLTHGVGLWISSLQEIHAKTIPSPEKVRDLKGKGSLPPKSFVSPVSAGLVLSSVKTCRGTLTDKSRPSSHHWKNWATALRQEYSRRPKPEILCGVSDCSSWPSPRTSDTNGAGMHGDGGMDLRTTAVNWNAPRANDAEKRGEIADDPRNGLVSQSEHWMAPNVPNGGRSTDHAEQVGATLYHDGKKVQMGLESQAKQWASSMAADDGHKVTEASHQAGLIGQVASFRPPSYPDQPIVAGAMSSTDGQNTNQPSVKRKLNPIFVEALMRWPTGLSGFERQEMALTRWWQLMPSYLSMLCSQKPDSQSSLFD